MSSNRYNEGVKLWSYTKVDSPLRAKSYKVEGYPWSTRALEKLNECPKQDDGSVSELATARQRVEAPRFWGCYVRNLRGDAVKGVDWRREVPGAYVLQPKRRYKYV